MTQGEVDAERQRVLDAIRAAWKLGINPTTAAVALATGRYAQSVQDYARGLATMGLIVIDRKRSSGLPGSTPYRYVPPEPKP